MSKLALLIGIDSYESEAFETLSCCSSDALAVKETLDYNWPHEVTRDGPVNYAAKVWTSQGQDRISTEFLRQKVKFVMNQSMGDGEVLFYFSGHGIANENGGFLVTQDATPEAPGYPMAELLHEANRSGNTSVLIILDCCHSGQIGNITDGEGFNQVSIGPNVTVLAGSGATQKSAEGWDHSLFTQLLLEGLQGGASDVRGEVSAASLYAYIEQSLGAWDQRPVYKSYARKLKAVRRCEPAVPDKVLARLTQWFPNPATDYQLTPAYECSHESADPELVSVFDQFKLLRNAHLLTTDEGKDLYWVALESRKVRLTPQGRLLWKRAHRQDF